MLDDEYDWRDIEDLLAHWKRRPPVQAMVQAYLGVRGADTEEFRVSSDEELAAARALSGG